VEYKPGPQHAVAHALFRIPTERLDTGPISQGIPTVGVAQPGPGWCRGTARGEPGLGGHDPHRHTGLVSPWATGIAPTLGVGPCSA